MLEVERYERLQNLVADGNRSKQNWTKAFALLEASCTHLQSAGRVRACWLRWFRGVADHA